MYFSYTELSQWNLQRWDVVNVRLTLHLDWQLFVEMLFLSSTLCSSVSVLPFVSPLTVFLSLQAIHLSDFGGVWARRCPLPIRFNYGLTGSLCAARGCRLQEPVAIYHHPMSFTGCLSLCRSGKTVPRQYRLSTLSLPFITWSETQPRPGTHSLYTHRSQTCTGTLACPQKYTHGFIITHIWTFNTCVRNDPFSFGTSDCYMWQANGKAKVSLLIVNIILIYATDWDLRSDSRSARWFQNSAKTLQKPLKDSQIFQAAQAWAVIHQTAVCLIKIYDASWKARNC